MKVLHHILVFSLLLYGAELRAAVLNEAETRYLTIDDVERYIPASSDFNLPNESSKWGRVTLPLIESPQHYTSMEDYEVSWFRIPRDELSLGLLTQPALYIWRHNVRAGAFIGDDYLGGTLQKEGDQSMNISWNHPLLIDIPSNAEGDLLFRVDAGPGGTVLAPIIVGERSALEGMYEERNFFQIELSFWLFILCGLLSGLSLWLWLQRRGEALYLEFSLLRYRTNQYAGLDHDSTRVLGFCVDICYTVYVGCIRDTLATAKTPSATRCADR